MNTTLTVYNPVPNKYISGFVQWAGIDHSVQLKNPVTDISSITLDSSTTIYPAAELHGSIYLPEGNVVIGDSGDVYIGTDISLMGVIFQVRDLQCRVCSMEPGCCSQNAALNVTTCECVCTTGFTGQGCTTRTCYNNGVWDGNLGVCQCPQPYTPESYCLDFRCGHNSILIEGQCTCIAPFSGPNCSAVITTEDSQDTRALWNYSIPGPRSNWGVAACYGQTCVCPPYYSVQANSIIERQVGCNQSDIEACHAYFHLMAPLCCTNAIPCEEAQLSRLACSTQPCCNKYDDAVSCFSAQGCYWDQGCTLVEAMSYDAVWKRFVVDCSTVTDPLCNPTVAANQAYYYQAEATKQIAFSNYIQQLAWREISQYDIWEDDLSHTIVFLTENGNYPAPCVYTWRLALAYDAPFLSTATWTCGNTNSLQTSFQFELIQNTSYTSIPPETLGSVYRVWVAGTTWCLMDRALQPDEMYLYNFNPAVPASLIAIDVGEHSLYATPDSCGIFRVQDQQFQTVGTMQYLAVDTATTTVILADTQGGIITTPPVYFDNVVIDPRPLPSTSVCRYLPCQVDLLRGYCRSLACARALLGPELFAECRPCLMAHVLLDENQ